MTAPLTVAARPVELCDAGPAVCAAATVAAKAANITPGSAFHLRIRCGTTLNAPAAKWKEPAGHYQAAAAAAKAGQNAPPTAQPPWPTIPCRDNRTGPDATCRQYRTPSRREKANRVPTPAPWR